MSRRGSYEVKNAIKVDLLAIKWIDNRSVTTLTSHDSTEPIKSVQRYDKKENAHIQVQCPVVIANYNKHMGGVGLLDGFLNYYRFLSYF